MSTRVPFTTAVNAQVRSDAQRFLRQIAPVFADLGAQWNGLATSSLPHLDPNFQLAYSYWRVGQYQAFSGYERVRQGNVFFAGEHCSTDFQGYMEGGASEGVRAANDILAAFGRHAMRSGARVRKA
jgi:monoamine oxidase